MVKSIKDRAGEYHVPGSGLCDRETLCGFINTGNRYFDSFDRVDHLPTCRECLYEAENILSTASNISPKNKKLKFPVIKSNIGESHLRGRETITLCGQMVDDCYEQFGDITPRSGVLSCDGCRDVALITVASISPEELIAALKALGS